MEKHFRPVIYFLLVAVLISTVSVYTWLRPREKMFSQDNPLGDLTDSEKLAVLQEVFT